MPLRIYRRLLRLYPRAFRERFGEEMAELVEERSRKAVRDGRAAARLLWWETARDLVQSVPREHLEDFRSRSRSRSRRFSRSEEGAMRTFVHDLRYGARSLAKQPFFLVLVVGMLALGIAGNIAVFSMVNGLLLKPLPFAEPERLVYLDETAPRWNLEFVAVAYPDFDAWRKHNQSFEAMAAFDDEDFNLSLENDAERVPGARVTHELAAVLGLRPVLGRNFLPEEDRPGAEKVALIGTGLWNRRFGADPAILGQRIPIDSEPHAVVGVLPPEASFVGREPVEIWVPLAADPAEGHGDYYLSGVGRLNKGVTVAMALEDLRRIHRGLAEERPEKEIVSPVVLPLRDRLVRDYERVTYLLSAAVAVVLLIACVNVAGLMLARGSARDREIAVRVALGAGRSRVIRQLLTEGFLLAAAGGLLGTLAGSWLLRALISALPEGLPLWLSLGLDGRVVFFSVATCAGAALLFGLAPALQASRADPRTALHGSAARSTRSAPKRRMLRALVVSEIALALILLIGAGLLIKAFHSLQRIDPGFRPENVLAFRITLPDIRYAEDSRQIAFFEELQARLGGMPGAESVSAITSPPLGGHWGTFFDVEGNPPPLDDAQDPVVLHRLVLPGYFRTMGIPILSGRGLEGRDGRTGGAGVVVVNETFARRFWPGGDPIGKRIRYRSSSEDEPWMTVVGLARDVKHYGLDEEMRPGVYIPYARNPVDTLSFVVKSRGDPIHLVEPAREAVRGLDAEIPLYDVRTMSERLAVSFGLRRAYSWCFGVFAAVALLLAMGGIYGVVSYTVTERTHEIGIRMALGARRRQVVGHVLSEGMKLTAFGVAAGLFASFWATRLLTAILAGTRAHDLLTYTAVTLGLAALALLANWIPARRAAALEPTSALRCD